MNSQATHFSRRSDNGFILLHHNVGSVISPYGFPYMEYGSWENLPKEAGVKHCLRLLSFSWLLSPVLLVSAWGQTTNGNIQGTVLDPQDAAVSGASVTGRNMDTGLTVVATTTSAGVFALANLPPGRYAVTVEAAGMKKFTQEGIT